MSKNRTKTGIVANINHQYVILNDKRHIEFTTILNFLLPNDIVEYIENDNGRLVITRLKERSPRYLYGIVTKIDEKYTYLYSPNLPKYFSPYVLNETFEIGDTVILFCSLGGITIHKKMSTIKNRKADVEMFKDLFFLNTTNITPQYEKTLDSFYTKPFEDLRHLNTFNVDPKNSTDFDDAISLDLEHPDKIYIHIVDANHSLNKQEAFRKTYTLYLPEHIENMIEDYRNYSLNLGEERNVITVEYTIDEMNEIVSYDIYPSIIIVKNRYDYEEFSTVLSKYPSLLSFNDKWKQNTLNIPHLQLCIDDNGCIENFYHTTNTDISHKVVETLMIVTNTTISKHLKDLPQRFHTKLKTYNEEKINITDNDVVNSILTVKHYKNALYSATEKGHDGLGLITYTHFTSPLRRYFDVIVHKILAGYTLINTDEVLSYINERERLIDSYTKFYSHLKLLDYFDSHKHHIYDGYVINKTEKGIVVFIPYFLYEVFIFTKLDLSVGTKVKVKINHVSWDNLTVKSVLI